MTRNLPQRLLVLALAASTALGCRAQVPAAGTKLSPELYRRVEILVRSRAKLPPSYGIEIGPRMASPVPGYSQVEITFTDGADKSKPTPFLVSDDGKTLAQLNTFDIANDPRTLVSGAGRPARGGPASAPVQIVGFDDLECPYCARMNAQIFPAVLERYGDKVRISYLDLPITQHPWAMRAAIDVNCLAAQSPAGYWNEVDYVHAHATDFGGPEHSLQKAFDTLDQDTVDEGKKEHVNETELQACIKKQDDTKIKASMKQGEDLEVDTTPQLFINGERFEGAYPLVDLYRFIDAALVAQGVTPPPPYVPPAPKPAGSSAVTAAPAK